MPKTFFCEACSFKTEKKSTYDKHITTKSHLNKLNNLETDSLSKTSCDSSVSCETCVFSVSSVSPSSNMSLEIDNTSFTSSRIRELEHQLQLKELEIERIKNEYEIKLKFKDEIIDILKQQNQTIINQPIVKEIPKKNIDLIIQEKEIQDEPKKQIVETKQEEKINIKEYLEKHRSKSPTIEECFKQYLYNSEYNTYLTCIEDIDGKEYNILEPSKIKYTEYKDRGIDNAIEILTNFFKTFPKEQLPFYCSDKRRNILYLKTEKGWIKQTETNETDIDNLLLQLIKNALNSICKALYHITLIFKNKVKNFNNIYNLSFDDWKANNISEIYSVMTLVGNDVSARVESDEERENKRLAIKNLKILLSNMSESIKAE